MWKSKVVYSHRPPILFSLMFAILADAFQDCDDCFPIRYRVNGNLFNLWLEAKSKIQTDVLDELLYADCVAKNVVTKKMQETMDRVSQVCDNYDLTSRKQNNRVGPKWSLPCITVTRQRLQVTYNSHLSLRLSVYISAIVSCIFFVKTSFKR